MASSPSKLSNIGTSLRKRTSKVRESIASVTPTSLLELASEVNKGGNPVINIFWHIIHKIRTWQSLHSQQEYRFWTSRTACFIYIDVWIALALQRVYLLYGVLLVLMLQIAWVALKWIFYILDDPAVRSFTTFASQWIRTFLKQGESILNGNDAQKYVLATALTATSTTGFGYAKEVLRYRTGQLNQRVLDQMKEQRNDYKTQDLRGPIGDLDLAR